uniref:Transmembrane protein 156 n=1 Tax=Panagrellus redivivus TaxID=6233 RepID=A0A7E4VSV5_PANRE
MAYWLLTFSLFCAFQACFESTLIPATDTDAVNTITNFRNVQTHSNNTIYCEFIQNGAPTHLSIAVPNSSFNYHIKLTPRKPDVYHTVTFKVLTNLIHSHVPSVSNSFDVKFRPFEEPCDKKSKVFNITFSSENVDNPFTLTVPSEVKFVKEYATITPKTDTFLTFESNEPYYAPSSPRKTWRIVGVSLIALVLVLCACSIACFICYKHHHEMLYLRERYSESNLSWEKDLRMRNVQKRRHPVATETICPSSSDDDSTRESSHSIKSMPSSTEPSNLTLICHLSASKKGF